MEVAPIRRGLLDPKHKFDSDRRAEGVDWTTVYPFSLFHDLTLVSCFPGCAVAAPSGFDRVDT